MLAALDRQAKQAAALAAEADATAAGKQLQLRLGQRVVHKEHGYRGVVVGWDVGCCEGEEWQERAGAEELKNGLRWGFWARGSVAGLRKTLGRWALSQHMHSTHRAAAAVTPAAVVTAAAATASRSTTCSWRCLTGAMMPHSPLWRMWLRSCWLHQRLKMTARPGRRWV
jgi:hypothetical protein